MQYYTSQQIFLSVLYSLIFGVCFGMFSSLVSVILEYIETLLNLPRLILTYSSEEKGPLTLFKEKPKLIYSEGRAKEVIKDFIVTLSFGISFSVLSYIAVDGELRLYVLLIALITSYFSNKIPGKGFRWLCVKLFYGICTVTVFIVSIILYPIRQILRFLTAKVLAPASVKLSTLRSKPRLHLCKTTKSERKKQNV